jgi:hypothetical protein
MYFLSGRKTRRAVSELCWTDRPAGLIITEAVVGQISIFLFTFSVRWDIPNAKRKHRRSISLRINKQSSRNGEK